MATDPATDLLDAKPTNTLSDAGVLRLQLGKECEAKHQYRNALRDLLAMVHADRGVAACRPGGDDACCRAQRLLNGAAVNRADAGMGPGRAAVPPEAPAAGEGTGSSGGAAGFVRVDYPGNPRHRWIPLPAGGQVGRPR